MLFGPGDEARIVALQRQGLWASGRPIQANETRAQSVEDREVALRQHGDGIGLESEREPLVAGKEPVELSLPLRRSHYRLRRHLADQRVFPARCQSAAMDGGRRNDPAAADEGAEAAREIETGEERVARGRDELARWHDDRAKETRPLDHPGHDRRALDLVGVENVFRGLSRQDRGELPR